LIVKYWMFPGWLTVMFTFKKNGKSNMAVAEGDSLTLDPLDVG